MRDLVDAAKEDERQLRTASVGAGSPHHLAMELIKDRTGAFIVHIPYRGAAPAVGRVGQSVAGNGDRYRRWPAAHTRGQAGAAGSVESPAPPALPNVPTLEEQGIRDTEVYAWQGMVVPAATTREISSKLTAELNRAIANPEVTRKLQEFGLEPIPATQSKWRLTSRARPRWHALIKQRGLTLD